MISMRLTALQALGPLALFSMISLRLLALFFEVDRLQKLADRLRAHADFEAGHARVAVLLFDLAQVFVVDDLLIGERGDRARVEHDVCGEIDDLLELLGAHVEQQADAGGHAAEIPDVRDGRGQLDVAHALAAHLGARHFDAALFADDALVADALVFAAVAFPVLGRPEDLFAEQAVLFGFLGAVVDGLRLGDLAVRPFPDLFGRSNTDLDGVKIV